MSFSFDLVFTSNPKSNRKQISSQILLRKEQEDDDVGEPKKSGSWFVTEQESKRHQRVSYHCCCALQYLCICLWLFLFRLCGKSNLWSSSLVPFFCLKQLRINHIYQKKIYDLCVWGCILQAGYSSVSQTGITTDLGLSVAQVRKPKTIFMTLVSLKV